MSRRPGRSIAATALVGWLRSCSACSADVSRRTRRLRRGTLAARSDVFGAARFQQVLGATDLRGGIAMNGKQRAAILDPSLVAFCLVLRNAHSHESPN